MEPLFKRLPPNLQFVKQMNMTVFVEGLEHIKVNRVNLSKKIGHGVAHDLALMNPS